MGNTDSVPVVSQVKSLVQVIGGDSTGALATQENFAYRNTFPIISQIASAGYAIGGDIEKAEDLQKKFADDMDKVLDSIPFVGHVKGGVHEVLGENKKAGNSYRKATGSATTMVTNTFGGPGVGFGLIATDAINELIRSSNDDHRKQRSNEHPQTTRTLKNKRESGLDFVRPAKVMSKADRKARSIAISGTRSGDLSSGATAAALNILDDRANVPRQLSIIEKQLLGKPAN